MPDENMGCGCGCQDCECKEVNVCEPTQKVDANLRDKLMVFKDYVCTIALTPCSQLGKVMSKVVYYLWCMLKDLVNMVINNRKRTETLMENDEYFCGRMSAVSEWTINLSNTQARNHKKITKFIDDISKISSKSNEDGYASEPLIQSLVFLREPDAVISEVSSPNSVKILNKNSPESELANVSTKYNRLMMDPDGKVFDKSTSHEFEDIIRNGAGAYFKNVGDSVTATYKNLKNTKIGEKKASSVKITYKLTKKEFTNDKASTDTDAILVLYNDPTRGVRTTVAGGNIEYGITLEFYDEDGKAITLDENEIVLSANSLNHEDTLLFGKKYRGNEYVNIESTGGSLVPINGSSIVAHSDGRGYANTNNVFKGTAGINEDGQTRFPSWDSVDNENFWFGSIGVKYSNPTGTTLNISYGAEKREEYWFTFNTNVPVPIVVKPTLEPLPTLPYECNIKEFEC